MHCARGIAPGWGSRRKGDEIEHCERVSVGIELARYIADSRDQLDANAIIFGERGKGEPVLGELGNGCIGRARRRFFDSAIDGVAVDRQWERVGIYRRMRCVGIGRLRSV